MTDNPKIYFGYPNHGDNPHDGLHIAASVIETLSNLIGSCEDLNLITRNSGVNGLNYILDSVQHCITTASDDLSKNQKTTIQDYMSKQGLPYEAMGNENMQRAWADGFKHGQLEAGEKPVMKISRALKNRQDRENIIAASYKEGSSVSDIAQAINLKKAQIEKVLFGLAEKGELPLRPDEEKARAANG